MINYCLLYLFAHLIYASDIHSYLDYEHHFTKCLSSNLNSLQFIKILIFQQH